MIKKDLILNLLKRGIIDRCTHGKNVLNDLCNSSSVAVYCGFDPTADSLHLGHLVPILCLKHFQLSGHKPILLIGGGTGLLGDPSFRLNQRKIHDIDVVKKWIHNICAQLLSFFDIDIGFSSPLLVNNYDWYNKMNILSFLLKVGKYYSINKIVNKKAIKYRFSINSRSDISISEFFYGLFQGYDFAYLNNKYGVVLQIGGSDQWGNIVTGIDLTKKIFNNQVYGLTVPLITHSNGIKFGKTMDNTIWLDPKKTSPYEFYQFWINITDKKVDSFLRLFTLINLNVLNNLKKNQYLLNKSGYIRHILADEVTKMVHGVKGLSIAKEITNHLFFDSLFNLTDENFLQLISGGIHTCYFQMGITLQLALIKSNLSSSFTQARIMISANSISINRVKKKEVDYVFTENDILCNKYTLLQKGKKKFCLIVWCKS